jgi:toxin ParE1/3/4
MASFGFPPEAMAEYTDAAHYYLRNASPRVAEAFLATVETAVSEILKSPSQWRIVEEPRIRRYICRRFPYMLYYRWEQEQEQVNIYAAMHCSREPGYWRHRSA